MVRQLQKMRQSYLPGLSQLAAKVRRTQCLLSGDYIEADILKPVVAHYNVYLCEMELFFYLMTDPGSCHQSSVEPQNKNNNACTAADSDKQLFQPKLYSQSLLNKTKSDTKEEKIRERTTKEKSVADNNSTKRDTQRTTPQVKSYVDMLKHRKSAEIKPSRVESNSRSLQKPVISPASQRVVSTEREEEVNRVYLKNSSLSTSQGKITHNITSRFGMKTFTVIPPKPAVSHDATGMPAATLTVGAIKIDDQGNMVRASIKHNGARRSLESNIGNSEGSPLLGKAKAFWSSNERQESAVLHNKGLIEKAKESTDGLKSTPTAVSETILETSNTEVRTTSLIEPAVRAQPKEMDKREEAKDPVQDIKVTTEAQVEVESKTSVSMHIYPPSNKPIHPHYILPELRKDLPFLKPSRRTSSQYVASAINKYTSNTSAKPNYIPKLSDSSVSLQTQTPVFQRSGWSIQVNPHRSSLSFLSDNKENESAFKSYPSGPKRSISYPEYVSDSQRDFVEVRMDREEFGRSVGSMEGNYKTLETETTKNKHIQSNGTTHINMASNSDGDHFKHVQLRSPSSARISPLHPSAKTPTTPKTINQGQTSVSKASTALFSSLNECEATSYSQLKFTWFFSHFFFRTRETLARLTPI